MPDQPGIDEYLSPAPGWLLLSIGLALLALADWLRRAQ